MSGKALSSADFRRAAMAGLDAACQQADYNANQEGSASGNAQAADTQANISEGQRQINRLEIEEGRQMAADFAASYYGYRPGTYDPDLNFAGNWRVDRYIKYGPGAFRYPAIYRLRALTKAIRQI